MIIILLILASQDLTYFVAMAVVVCGVADARKQQADDGISAVGAITFSACYSRRRNTGDSAVDSITLAGAVPLTLVLSFFIEEDNP